MLKDVNRKCMEGKSCTHEGCLEAKVEKERDEILVECLRDGGEALGKALDLQRLKITFFANEMLTAIFVSISFFLTQLFPSLWPF